MSPLLSSLIRTCLDPHSSGYFCREILHAKFYFNKVSFGRRKVYAHSLLDTKCGFKTLIVKSSSKIIKIVTFPKKLTRIAQQRYVDTLSSLSRTSFLQSQRPESTDTGCGESIYFKKTYLFCNTSTVECR